jgi:hypothetical protein
MICVINRADNPRAKAAAAAVKDMK